MIKIGKRCVVKGLFLSVAMLFWGAISLNAASLEVVAKLDRNKVYMDEPAEYTLTVSGGSGRFGDPVLPIFKGFRSRSIGTSSNFSYINGEMTAQRTYRYLLIPQVPGRYVIPPATVLYEGERYRTESLEIEILSGNNPNPPAATMQPGAYSSAVAGNSNGLSSNDATSMEDLLFVKTEVDKPEVYVNEQIVLKFKFYHRTRLLSQPAYQPPSLEGFWKEELGEQTQYDEYLNGQRYSVVEMKTALFPIRSGELEIGSAKLQCRVPVSSSRRRSGFFGDDFFQMFSGGQDVLLQSKPIQIKVKPLPLTGQPQRFDGYVGQYELKASLSKSEVSVGESTTLQVEFEGRGFVKNVQIASLPEMDGLKIYTDDVSQSEVSAQEGAIYSKHHLDIALIPEKEGIFDIPELKISYFNPETEKYAVLSTPRLSLAVSASVAGSQNSIEPKIEMFQTSGGSVPSLNNGIKSSERQRIRFIHSGPKGNQNWPVWTTFSGMIILLLLPLLVLALILLGRFYRKKYVKTEQELAKKSSRNALKKIAQLSKEASGEKFYSQIEQLLLAYLGAKLEVSPYGLTQNQIQRLLQEKGVKEEIVKDVLLLLGRVNEVRYSLRHIGQEQLRQDGQRAEQVIKRIEAVLV